MTADVPGGQQLLFIQKYFFLAGSTLGDVQGGVDALVGDVSIQRQFHVAGAFEFFKDHLIHTAAGFDQTGGDDGQATPVFDFAGGTEQPFGDFEGAVVQTTGHRTATARAAGIKRTAKTGE